MSGGESADLQAGRSGDARLAGVSRRALVAGTAADARRAQLALGTDGALLAGWARVSWWAAQTRLAGGTLQPTRADLSRLSLKTDQSHCHEWNCHMDGRRELR